MSQAQDEKADTVMATNSTQNCEQAEPGITVGKSLLYRSYQQAEVLRNELSKKVEELKMQRDALIRNLTLNQRMLDNSEPELSNLIMHVKQLRFFINNPS